MAHPVIFAAIAGATLNVAFNASSIHNFGNFMTYAAIGMVSGAAGAGVGLGVGGVFGSFWGTLAGSFTSGFISGAGNAGSTGANFGQALAFGLTAGGIATATAAVLYGAEKAIGAIKNAAAVRARASGVKTPVGQQNGESAAGSLNTNKGEAASGSQALSSGDKKIRIRVKINEVTTPDGQNITGHRYVQEAEALIAEKTGYVPNTTETGTPKNVFYTPDEPTNSASQAVKAYNLKGMPTHRVDIDTTTVTNTYGGNVEGGTGIEMATEQQIPVVDIQKLNQ